MSFGVRSMLAFWIGGAAIPSTVSTPTVKLTGSAGLLYLKRKPQFPAFRKWRQRRRGR